MKFYNNIPYDNIDPCFNSFRQDGYKEEEGWITNFLGSAFSNSAFSLSENNKGTHYEYFVRAIMQTNQNPRFANSEDYYEYVALLQSILSAEKQYSMIKLGAYHGRWEAFACEANKQHKDLPIQITSIDSNANCLRRVAETFVKNKLDEYNKLDHEIVLGCVNKDHMPGAISYPKIDLNRVIERQAPIDLLDCDIQSGEKGLFEQHEDAMKRVRRVLIGTHSETIHTNIERLFQHWGWTCKANLPFRKRIQTEYGELITEDGLQHWVNPRLT